MSFESKLRRSKARLEKKLKEKQAKRDKLGKELFDFPNLTVPLCLWTFSPPFLVLAVLSRIYGAYKSVNPFAVFWGVFGLFGIYLLRNLEQRWFTPYGNRGILKTEIPWHKGNILVYLLCCAAIIGSGMFLKTGAAFFIYAISVSGGCVYLALRKDAVLWDMPTARILGFKKYIFEPLNGDNHAIRGIKQQCVVLHGKQQEEKVEIEGTFIGKDWFYLRAKKEDN